MGLGRLTIRLLALVAAGNGFAADVQQFVFSQANPCLLYTSDAADE